MTLLFADLKEACRNAQKKKEDIFIVDNNVLVTRFAKYMIEYLEMQSCPDDMQIELQMVDAL